MNNSTDLALLRRFEPVIRFTKGERFFPMDVERYVESSSLWVQRPNQEALCLISENDLELDDLTQPFPDEFGAVHFLKLTEPLNAAEMALYTLQRSRSEWQSEDVFHAGRGRLARVGYISRLVDAGFALTLLARGRVPGDSAAAAIINYRYLQDQEESYRYYGRVVRENGWIILQYWFFYMFNNWRSGFFGANDHESDWEMICVYLSESPTASATKRGERHASSGGYASFGKGEARRVRALRNDTRTEKGAHPQGMIKGRNGPELAKETATGVASSPPIPQAPSQGGGQKRDIQPEWVAYASHDYAGDDLRRRWDDPEVEKVGEHPVVYAGAGSHASYYQAGEYLTELELSFLAPVMAVTDRLQTLWHEKLQQYKVELPEDEPEQASNLFRIPFVDYARGDGLTIGPGEQREWETPGLLNPIPKWVSNYRGLWGLYTRDPFEDAPAGPMYNRDGSVRRSWYDPLGWAGLDKVPPRQEVLKIVQAQQALLTKQRLETQASIQKKSEQLKALGIEAASMRGQPHLSKMYEAYEEQIATLSKEIDQLRAQLASDEALLASLGQYKRQVEAGELGEPRSHIHRAHQPASDAHLRMSRLAETWAAASIGLTLLGIVALSQFAPDSLVLGIVTIMILFVFIEATFRGQLIRLVTGITIGLAALCAFIILYEFFYPLIILVVLVTGSYLLWENLRELWT